MTESALSDEADPLYRPLEGPEAWATDPVDVQAWARALGRLRSMREDLPDWSGMVAQGALLAAAHQSGALDGLYGANHPLALALLRGEASLAAADEVERGHARANYSAIRLARGGDVSEAMIREIHEVACRPQGTHRVRVDGRVQDHVLAPGDYKHHPNHVPLPGGGWLATAPVAQVGPEMARLVAAAAGRPFSGLHPLAQAAWLHQALLHIQPFADGNGRVARALASRCLLRAASVPFLVFAAEHGARYEKARGPGELVGLVQQAFVELVELLSSSSPDAAALERWRRQGRVARELHAALVPAVEKALDRHRRRPLTGWQADLSTAHVVPGETIVIRVPLDERGVVIDESVAIDAHPLDGSPVTATAREAQLRLEVGEPLEPWLDRVVSTLALRVAAELE